MTDAPIDPFAPFRDGGEGACLGDFDGEAIPVILRYRDVRLAAKDWARFSSAAPGRVPIPAEDGLRSLRQLPIETDPPEHGAWRALLKDWFRRPATDPAYAPRIRAIVDRALDEAAEGQPFDVEPLALAIQSRALAVLLAMPEEEAEGWIAWGTHAFMVDGQGDPERAARLDAYIAAHVERALADPTGPDLFCHLARATKDGRPLAPEEIAGVLHVTFAGGRDTVIDMIVESVAHLAANPADLEALRDNPALAVTATEELVRHVSPLTYIGRVCARDDSVGGHPRRAGERVALCWGAANFDPAVFDRPEEVRLDRRPNPHVAFGSGDHNCIGSTHARLVIRTVLERLAARAGEIRLHEAERAAKSVGGVLRRQGFRRLRVSVEGREGG
jgi:cytochrome P450